MGERIRQSGLPVELDQFYLDKNPGGPDEGIESPTVSWPVPSSNFQPDLANRHVHEWPAIVDVLAGRGPHRILMIEGESGLGKSELIHQTAKYAAQIKE